jgi:aryl-alcohol dehydrogenase-like predicted oxidoreductase
MQYRELGATGSRVSVVGLGTWQLGGEWGRTFTPAEVRAIFDAARDEGITLVDTAECYGDHEAERLVGEAIRGDRDRWFVATKFGHRYTVAFERDQLWEPRDVERQLEDSLAALGTGVIDLYQFHSGTRAAFDNEELWSLLSRKKRQGMIRHIGISVASSIPAADQEYQVGRAREVGAECIQVVYNRLQPGAGTGILPLAAASGLGVLARVPLASGFLTGKYGAGASFEPGDVRSRRSADEIARLAVEAERIRREEVPAGTLMAAWALAWCLRAREVTAVIPGCKDPGQVRSNAAAALLSGSVHP